MYTIYLYGAASVFISINTIVQIMMIILYLRRTIVDRKSEYYLTKTIIFYLVSSYPSPTTILTHTILLTYFSEHIFDFLCFGNSIFKMKSKKYTAVISHYEYFKFINVYWKRRSKFN